MTLLSFKIYKTKYAFELQILNKIREFKEGLSLCNLDVGYSWYSHDHTPRLYFELIACNIMLIEFTVYNTWHSDDLEFRS